MGERIIDNKFNVLDNYKEMHIINKYRFGGANVDLLTNLISVFEMQNLDDDILDVHGSNTGYDYGTTHGAAGFGNFTYSYDFVSANSDRMVITDDDSLTFGNGTTDSPFSVNIWVNPDSVTTWFFVDKYTTGGQIEWLGPYISSGDLKFRLYDASSGGIIGQGITNPVTTGSWQMLTATYDGSSSASGIKIYKNASLLSTTSYTSGSYTAMENTTSNVFLSVYGGSGYADGSLIQFSIWGKELDTDQITALYNSGDGLLYTNWA